MLSRQAAYIGVEVGECSGMENHICRLSPSRQSSGSMRLSRESVESEKRTLDRTLRGTNLKVRQKGMGGWQEEPGQWGISEMKRGEVRNVMLPSWEGWRG